MDRDTLSERVVRQDAWWEHQRQWNKRTEAELADIKGRQQAIAGRFYWMAGVAAAVGAGLASIPVFVAIAALLRQGG